MQINGQKDGRKELAREEGEGGTYRENNSETEDEEESRRESQTINKSK